MTDATLDMTTIETRARALRAAYMRDALARFVARIRGIRATGSAHA